MMRQLLVECSDPGLVVAIAADDYTRRRLGLATTCGEGFLRVRIDGAREPCCFGNCEVRRD